MDLLSIGKTTNNFDMHQPEQGPVAKIYSHEAALRDVVFACRLADAQEAALTQMQTLRGLARKATYLLEFLEEDDRDFAGELAHSLAQDILLLAHRDGGAENL